MSIYALFAIILAAYASASEHKQYIVEQRPLCEFRYDEKLQTRAATVLQRELTSEIAQHYDPRFPIVTICHSKAILMFNWKPDAQGWMPLDPPNMYIDVDICSHKILSFDRDDGMTVTDRSPCK